MQQALFSEPSPTSFVGEGAGEGPLCARFAAKRAIRNFRGGRSSQTQERAAHQEMQARRKGTLTLPSPANIRGRGHETNGRKKRRPRKQRSSSRPAAISGEGMKNKAGKESGKKTGEKK
jgi:hypothetical protein